MGQCAAQWSSGHRSFTAAEINALKFNLAWVMVPPLVLPTAVLPQVRRIQLIHITGTATVVGDLHGLPARPITDVGFRRCVIQAQRGLIL